MQVASVSCNRVSSALPLAILFLGRVKFFPPKLHQNIPKITAKSLTQAPYIRNYKYHHPHPYSHSDLAHRWSCGRPWAWLWLISPKSSSTPPPLTPWAASLQTGLKAGEAPLQVKTWPSGVCKVNWALFPDPRFWHLTTFQPWSLSPMAEVWKDTSSLQIKASPTL